MKITKTLAAFTLVLVCSAFMQLTVASWKIVPGKYTIQFSATEVEGNFKKLDGEIKFDETNLAQSSMQIQIDVNSIETGNPTKNEHAKAEDWLNAAVYPSIKFSSTGFTKTAAGFDVVGKLTMKDVTKDITIPFTFTKKKKVGVFKGGFSVNRTEYHMEGDGIGETVTINFTIPVKPVNQ